MGKLSPKTKVIKSMEFHRHALNLEIGKRVSKCYICGKPIPANTDRVALRSMLERSLKARRGGSITGYTYFFHPVCISNFFLPTEGRKAHDPLHECSHCGNDLDHRRYVRSTQNRLSYTYICSSCSAGPHFRYCKSCNLHVKRYEASEVIEGQFVGHFLCDFCAKERYPDSVTVKERKRENRVKRNEGG